MYLALPAVDRKPLFNGAHEKLKTAMHLANVADNECSPK